MFSSKRFKQITFVLFSVFSLFFYLIYGTGGDDVLGSAYSDDEKYLVIRVVDGDTFLLESGEYVRFIGIDAPEKTTHECYADESSEYLKSRIEGKYVNLVSDVNDRDRYKRYLRYVYLDGTFINMELVQEGYAKEKAYPPDTKYQELLKDAETRARDLRFGLWRSCY